jgi:hypothetical protein
MKVFGVSTSQLPQYFDAIDYLGNKTGATADNILKAVRLQPSDLYYAELFEQEALVVSHSITSEAYFRLPYPLVPRLLRMT